MIRVLVTAPLTAETIDQLNAVPEFDVVFRPELAAGELAGELAGVEALVCADPRALERQALDAAADLKLVIVCGGAARELPPALGRGAEVRRSDGGLSTLALLKDFFNA